MKLRGRWYDQERACRVMLEQVRDMPQDNVREFCARVIQNFAEKLRRRLALTDMNTVGISGVAALYKFGHYKRRWYDAHPALHGAVGMLYSLPPEALSALGYKLGDTFGLIRIYAQVCHEVGETPKAEHMSKICTVGLQTGVSEARDVLVTIIGPDLYQALGEITQAGKAPHPPNTP